jgi:hypothetical protein
MREGDNQEEIPAIGMSTDAVRRMRHDPFLQFDPSSVRLNAYYRWIRGMPGASTTHWLAAEAEEIFRQAKEQLVFAGSGINGFRYAPLYNHFDLLTSWRCGQQTSKVALGPKEPRICCICGCSRATRTFGADSHVIPEMFGCRELLSNEECDECNRNSGETWETELGLLTLGDRAFAGVRGKGTGVPKIKSGNGFIGGKTIAGLTNIASSDERMFRIAEPNRAEVDVPQMAARPAQAARAIAKIGWLMMSSAQREAHRGLLPWLLSSSEQKTRLFHLWMATRIPTTAAVWERVDGDDGLTTLIVMLAFGHTMLLWGAPNWQTGHARDLLLPPLPKGAEASGTLTAQRYEAGLDDRTVATTRKITLSFESRHRVHLSQPVAVEIVVGKGDEAVRLATRAVSPAGATAERPQFQLRGGDLAGAVRIDAGPEPGRGAWSFDAVAASGNPEQTLAIVTRIWRGEPVDVVCRDDGAFVLRAATFAANNVPESEVRRLVWMAHYLGIIGEQLGVDFKVDRFTDDDFELAQRLWLGITRGRVEEGPQDDAVTIDLPHRAVEALAAAMGATAKTLAFSCPDEREYGLLGAQFSMGPTRMVLSDASVETGWDHARELSKRDGHARVVFRCKCVTHIFERFASASPLTRQSHDEG